jgi:transposase InsO family protein
MLRVSGLLVKKKRNGTKTTDSYHRFHVPDAGRMPSLFSEDEVDRNYRYLFSLLYQRRIRGSRCSTELLCKRRRRTDVS